jgi:hypothetical protein
MKLLNLYNYLNERLITMHAQKQSKLGDNSSDKFNIVTNYSGNMFVYELFNTIREKIPAAKIITGSKEVFVFHKAILIDNVDTHMNEEISDLYSIVYLKNGRDNFGQELKKYNGTSNTINAIWIKDKLHALCLSFTFLIDSQTIDQDEPLMNMPPVKAKKFNMNLSYFKLSNRKNVTQFNHQLIINPKISAPYWSSSKSMNFVFNFFKKAFEHEDVIMDILNENNMTYSKWRDYNIKIFGKYESAGAELSDLAFCDSTKFKK